MGVRSLSKGEAAASPLRKEFPNAKIDVWILDMKSYDSVQEFAERCDGLERIDIVILNAGFGVVTPEKVEATGHEATLQVNYLSTVLLAILLLPIIKRKRAIAGRVPKMTIVGSDSAYGATLDAGKTVFEQFDDAPGTGGFKFYRLTKLLLVQFVERLAKVVSGDDVVINVVNPGMTKGTAFMDRLPRMVKPIVNLVWSVLGRTVESGASTYLDAVLGYGREAHGKFLSDWRIRVIPEFCYTLEGEKVSEKLWEETMKEFEFAKVDKILDNLRSSD